MLCENICMGKIYTNYNYLDISVLTYSQNFVVIFFLVHLYLINCMDIIFACSLTDSHITEEFLDNVISAKIMRYV